jgi:hypothetical protein
MHRSKYRQIADTTIMSDVGPSILAIDVFNEENVERFRMKSKLESTNVEIRHIKSLMVKDKKRTRAAMSYFTMKIETFDSILNLLYLKGTACPKITSRSAQD